MSNRIFLFDIDGTIMSTHGAGILEKFVGTNASSLVTYSPIPVIVVPRYYHTKRIEKRGKRVFRILNKVTMLRCLQTKTI